MSLISTIIILFDFISLIMSKEKRTKSTIDKSKLSREAHTFCGTLSTAPEISVEDRDRTFIYSQFFTLQIAVNYLFLWRKKPNLIHLLLKRILDYPRQKIIHFIPTIIFVMTLTSQAQQNYEFFIQKLSTESFSSYLLIRWAFATYIKNQTEVQQYQSKLDSSLLKYYTEDIKIQNIQNFSNKEEQEMALGLNSQREKQGNQSPSVKKSPRKKTRKIITQPTSQSKSIQQYVDKKLKTSEYLLELNECYQKLFKIPQRLKKYTKQQRKAKLKEYLERIQTKFIKRSYDFVNGIVFPFEDNSIVCKGIFKDGCFPFSTKQRVPFKLVLETISIEDASKQLNKQLQSVEQFKKIQEDIIQEERQKNKTLMLPHSFFGQQWTETKIKIRLNSPYGQLPSYQIRSFLIKSGDDLRQQYLAMQLIKQIQGYMKKENLKLWVRSYDVIPYNSDSGLIQFVDDTRTISYLKEVSNQKSLKVIYQQLFVDNFEKAIMNFLESLAGYSLIQYLFQIKDRHNNNILIDREGHIIHIDFSFMFASSPGGIKFERAPFKLVQDYVDIMEGPQSDIYKHFHMLFFLGLKYLRKYKRQIIQTVQAMANIPDMKCFLNFDMAILAKRFHETATDKQLLQITQTVIWSAWSSYMTGGYDKFQWLTNSIYS